MLQIPEGKKIFPTLGVSILSSDDTDVSSLAPCSHEEADSRMMIHVSDASLNGHHRIKIRTNDTDVLVLAISIASLLPVDELWVSIGSSKTRVKRRTELNAIEFDIGASVERRQVRRRT